MNSKIAIIGCGNMGQALLRGLFSDRIFSKRDIVVADKQARVRTSISKSYGIKAFCSSVDAVEKSDIVLLAVKPQDFPHLLEDIADAVKGKLVISIAAGIKTQYIMDRVPLKRIVRVMPNLPALAGAGLSAICHSPGANRSDIRIATDIFRSVGEVVYLKEDLLDAATSISGSGPAYFFMLMNSMIDEAVSMGIDKKMAEHMVFCTALGAPALLGFTNNTPADLCKQVASKGGTTEAALKVLKKGMFDRTVKHAIRAAFKRSRELSKIS
jgi:pyrroline-5-carboxylate reductase